MPSPSSIPDASPSSAPPHAFRAVVLAGGEALPDSMLAAVSAAIDDARLVVAADGGIAHAHRVDRDPHVLIGDLDSISPEALARATAGGTHVLRHPTDKDLTDLGLALDHVLEYLCTPDGAGDGAERGVDEGDVTRPVDVLVVGGHGGRSDHLLGNALLLAAPRYAPLRLTAWWGTDVLHVVRDTLEMTGESGATVSLLAVHGPARGVTSEGLTFPLDDADLEPGSPLGISNTLAAAHARVRLTDGVLLVIRPDALR
jgi:thiamine pyrophosphokinase